MRINSLIGGFVLLTFPVISACSPNSTSGSESPMLSTISGVESIVQADFKFPSDACQVVTGEEAADLLGGQILNAKAIPMPDSPASRCVYIISFPGDPDPEERAYVLWTLLADDYTGMKEVHEGPITELSGIGDEGFISFNQEDERFDLLTVLTSKVTIEVTGPDEESVKKLASHAISKLKIPQP